MWAKFIDGKIFLYPDGQSYDGEELTIEEALELAGSIYKACIIGSYKQ
jgi:hypothetical protein